MKGDGKQLHVFTFGQPDVNFLPDQRVETSL